MSELALYKNIMLLGSGINICLEKGLCIPALVLIYSGIDTVGWLNSTQQFASKKTFRMWVDDYLLKAGPLPCSSLELYAARCGLLHTLTSDFELSSNGKLRRIFYVWGSASVEALQRSITLTGNSNRFVAIHINDLYEAWCLGVLQFVESLEINPAKKDQVYKKADKFFTDILNKGKMDPIIK